MPRFLGQDLAPTPIPRSGAQWEEGGLCLGSEQRRRNQEVVTGSQDRKEVLHSGAGARTSVCGEAGRQLSGSKMCLGLPTKRPQACPSSMSGICFSICQSFPFLVLGVILVGHSLRWCCLPQSP